MSYSEDDTLRMLRDAVAAFTQGSGERVRKARTLEDKYDRRTWKQIADQGWIAALIPEDRGGLGLGCEAMSIIAKGLGRSAMPEPYIPSGVLPITLLSMIDPASSTNDTMSSIASGDLMCALAWQNESVALDPSQTPLRATTESATTTISGTAHHLMTSGLDAVLATVINGDVLELYWVPISMSGIKLDQTTRADWGRDVSITFQAVRVPSRNLVARGSILEQAFNRTIDEGLVAIAAELNGVTEKMFDMTLDYLKTRNQFGKPIGSFQALRHRAVDLWMHHQISDAATQDAARNMDESCTSEQMRTTMASGAKSRASDVSLLVGKQAIQMHGAIGITDEYDLSIYFNRALVLSAYLGNGSFHRARYATLRGA